LLSHSFLYRCLLPNNTISENWLKLVGNQHFKPLRSTLLQATIDVLGADFSLLAFI